MKQTLTQQLEALTAQVQAAEARQAAVPDLEQLRDALTGLRLRQAEERAAQQAQAAQQARATFDKIHAETLAMLRTCEPKLRDWQAARRAAGGASVLDGTAGPVAEILKQLTTIAAAQAAYTASRAQRAADAKIEVAKSEALAKREAQFREREEAIAREMAEARRVPAYGPVR